MNIEELETQLRSKFHVTRNRNLKPLLTQLTSFSLQTPTNITDIDKLTGQETATMMATKDGLGKVVIE